MSKADAFDQVLAAGSSAGRTDNMARFLSGLRGNGDVWPLYDIEEADETLANRIEGAMRNTALSSSRIKRTIDDLGYRNVGVKAVEHWRKDNGVKG